MSDVYREDETGAREENRATERRSYVTGYLVSLALTAPPFALVAWGDEPRSVLWWVIGGCALAQIAAHFRWFLHIRLRGQAREDLQLILFSALILVLMAGGTIWIMANLAQRM